MLLSLQHLADLMMNPYHYRYFKWCKINNQIVCFKYWIIFKMETDFLPLENKPKCYCQKICLTACHSWTPVKELLWGMSINCTKVLLFNKYLFYLAWQPIKHMIDPYRWTLLDSITSRKTCRFYLLNSWNINILFLSLKFSSFM